MLSDKKGISVAFAILAFLLILFMYSKYQEIYSELETLKLENSRLVSLNQELANKQAEKLLALEKEIILSSPVIEYTAKVSEVVEPKNNVKSANVEEIKTGIDKASVSFDEQEIDYDWAVPIEATVIDTFIYDESIYKFELQRVECRTSICELTISNAMKDTLHQSALVIMALEKKGLERESFQYSERLEDGSFKLYLSLNKY